MSRGHGDLQRFILEQVSAHRDEAHPIPVLAHFYARERGISDTRTLRSSLRRAANRLHEQGEVALCDVLVPTRWLQPREDGQERPSAWRVTLCVAAAEVGEDWSPELQNSARYGMLLFQPETED
jgi:hypothetical protein